MDFELLMLCRKVKAPPLEMALLKELAIFFNPTTKQCNPTGEQLAEVTRFSEASVWRGIESLKKMGFISSDNPKTRGKGNFIFNIDSITMSANSLTIREPKKKELSHHENKLSHGEMNSLMVREKLSHGETQRSKEEIKKCKEEVREAQAPDPPLLEKQHEKLQYSPQANQQANRHGNPQSAEPVGMGQGFELDGVGQASSLPALEKLELQNEPKAEKSPPKRTKAEEASSLPLSKLIVWTPTFTQFYPRLCRFRELSSKRYPVKMPWTLDDAESYQQTLGDLLNRYQEDALIDRLTQHIAQPSAFLFPLHLDRLPLKGAVNGKPRPPNGGDFASAEANKDNLPKYNPNLDYNLKI